MRDKFIYLIGALLLCSCNNSAEKQENREFRVNNDTISIPDSSSVLQKIKVERLDYSEYNPDFTTSGIVKAIPTLYAEIAMPFGGRITKSFIRLGQAVKKGTPLFELSSPSFFETSKAYFEAKQERDQALKILKRERDLFANHVGVKKDVEEAEVNYQLKQQDFANASSALKVFQVNPSTIKLGEPLIVRSPINGKVVKDDIVIGQYVKEDAASLATIADLAASLKNIDVAKLALTVAHRENIPEFDLSVGYSHNTEVKNEIAPAPKFNGLTVGISLPLNFSSLNKGAVRSAKYKIQQAQDEYEQAKLEIQTEVLQNYQTFLSTGKQMERFNNGLMKNSSEVLKGKIYSYNRGETSLLEVLNAQRTYNDVHTLYIEAQYNHAISLVELENSIGIWDIDIK